MIIVQRTRIIVTMVRVSMVHTNAENETYSKPRPPTSGCEWFCLLRHHPCILPHHAHSRVLAHFFTAQYFQCHRVQQQTRETRHIDPSLKGKVMVLSCFFCSMKLPLQGFAHQIYRKASYRIGLSQKFEPLCFIIISLHLYDRNLGVCSTCST